MPELPEVETFRRFLEKHALNQVIKKIDVRDDRILEMDERKFINALLEKKFISSQRHGKNLFVKYNSQYLFFHFGMSGDFDYFEHKDDEPKHSRVLFHFENGKYFSYISQRLFGTVNIIKNPKEFIKEKRLGPDALNMTFEEFQQAIERRSAMLKSALLNQSIFAGIGNIYSDEILFQSHLHPKQKINELDDDQLKTLFANIKKVLKYGIKKKGRLNRYSKDCLIPHRDKEGTCPSCQGNIERFSLSGRHGFYCPNCQEKI